MANDFATEQSALGTEVRHWRRASIALTDLEVLAAPAAWLSLESYLGLSIRSSLRSISTSVVAEADHLSAALAAARTAAELRAVRTGLLKLRQRYEQVETVLDFYGDAVNTRTNPRIGAVLRGLDAIAVDSMDRVLRPLGIPTPPVLTYLDKGIGASILRSGARLWDASLSPVAAIKITRHNLWRPTSLVHETGHQVAHLTGWTEELGSALYSRLAPVSVVAAESWRNWASEVAADVYAFVLLGYAPLPALATVVDGPSRKVYRMPFGDPHPFGWVRVLFNAGLCRSWFGPGPWDDLARAWINRHPLEFASREEFQLGPVLGHLREQEADRRGGDRAVVVLRQVRRARLRQHRAGVAHEPGPVPRTGAELAQRGQQGGPAEPAVGIPHPAVQDAACAHPADRVESGDQGADDVDGERIHQGGHPCAPHEALDPGQVRVGQQADAGLQENDGGEAAFEDGHVPQLGAEGGDVIVGQFRMAAQRVADGAAHGSDGRAVVAVATTVPGLGLLGAAPRRLALERKVDEFAGFAHAAILPHKGKL